MPLTRRQLDLDERKRQIFRTHQRAARLLLEFVSQIGFALQVNNTRRTDGAQKARIIAVSCLSLLTAKIVFFELSGDYIRQDADYTVSPAGKKKQTARSEFFMKSKEEEEEKQENSCTQVAAGDHRSLDLIRELDMKVRS